MQIRIEDYSNQLNRLAWSFKHTTNLPFEDLQAVTYLAFTEARIQYKPDKAKFTTFLHHHTTRSLIDYSNKESRKRVEEAGQTTHYHDPAKTVEFRDTLLSLSQEAQVVCAMIFESPAEFLKQGAPKLSRGLVKDRLREMGYPWSVIWNSFHEIKNALSKTTL